MDSRVVVSTESAAAAATAASAQEEILESRKSSPDASAPDKNPRVDIRDVAALALRAGQPDLVEDPEKHLFLTILRLARPLQIPGNAYPDY